MKKRINLITIFLWFMIIGATFVTKMYFQPIHYNASEELETYRRAYRDKNNDEDPFYWIEESYITDPDKVNKNELIKNRVEYYMIADYIQNGIERILAISGIILFVITLLLSYKKCQSSSFVTFFTKKMPYEITCITFFITLIASISYGSRVIFNIQDNFNIFDVLSPQCWQILSITMILILLYTTITGIALILRHIQHQGRRVLHQHSIICKNSINIKRFIKQAYHYVTNIDLSDKKNRHLLIIIVLNYMLICILCMMWLVGIFVAIPYSFFLFYFMNKRSKKTIRDFEVLSKVIEQVAEGSPKHDINENLGAFESLKDNLQHLQTNFHKAVEQEVRSQNMKTELITNVSHDLKTPLTSIISYIDLLKKDNVSKEDHDKYLATLETSSNRLKHLIEDLFEVSKANSKNITLNYMTLDIIALLKQTQTEYESIFEHHNLSLRNTFSSNKILVSLDSQKTYRIFENLFSNIGKYSLEGTRVYVQVQEEDKFVQIMIRNISAEEPDFDTDNIMERFVRGDKSRNTEGSGLGLAIAKSFTEVQNGTMKIQLDGDIFKVHLQFPIQEEQEDI